LVAAISRARRLERPQRRVGGDEGRALLFGRQALYRRQRARDVAAEVQVARHDGDGVVAVRARRRRGDRGGDEDGEGDQRGDESPRTIEHA
jgi:hypothetical protein